jgi:hypothetical protein
MQMKIPADVFCDNREREEVENKGRRRERGERIKKDALNSR